MAIKEKQRIEYIDALKGFAIFFVLWGHSVQYLKNDYDFLHNPVFEFIYSFHMSLFFMISGFFFHSSLRLNFKEFLHKKSIQLLLPCLVWATLYYLVTTLTAILNGDEFSFSYFFEVLKLIVRPGGWSWFLRELFISYFIVYVFLKTLKKSWLACLLSISFVLIMPYCEIQRVFLPVFWAGFYLKENYRFIAKQKKLLSILLGTIFAICLWFWDGNYTMYVAGFPRLLNIRTLSFDFANVDISLFRLFIGLCGSLFWFVLFDWIYKDNKFFYCYEKMGINTLSIYLLQRVILEGWINEMVDLPNVNIWIYNLIVTPLISLTVLMICLVIIAVVQKNKYAELLLFGKM